MIIRKHLPVYRLKEDLFKAKSARDWGIIFGFPKNEMSLIESQYGEKYETCHIN